MRHARWHERTESSRTPPHAPSPYAVRMLLPSPVKRIALSSHVRLRSASTSGARVLLLLLLLLLCDRPMRRVSCMVTRPLRWERRSLVPSGCHARAMTSPGVFIGPFFTSDRDAAYTCCSINYGNGCSAHTCIHRYCPAMHCMPALMR